MKKLFSLIIVTTILFSAFCFATSGDKTYDDGYRDGVNDGYDDGYNDGLGAGKQKVPIVTFIEERDIPEVVAGETINFPVKFKNDSLYSAKELTITPLLEGTPLVYERPLKYRYKKTLRAADEAETSFNIKVSEDAKIGTYPVKFKLEFINSRDEAYTREETLYFRITEERLKPILTISNIKNSLEEIKAGDTFILNFDLNNIGGSEAEKVEVSLEGFGQTTFMPVDARDYNYIGTINQNESSTQSFMILTSKDISSENNVITANVTYQDREGKEYGLSKNLYIIGVNIGDNTSDEDVDKAAKPKMIISSYGISPNKDVVAGDVFSLGFTFKNTSKERRIRNIKITVSSEEGAFIITRGSNTFYIEEMDKLASVTREIELKAKQDLSSNSYKVILSFDYEDFSGNQYTATETLNIPVVEYSKLVINSVYAGEGYVNSNINLSFDYVNMGKATVSNLTASVEGDYESVQSINYIGNLVAGTSDYYDIEVKPTKEGANYGTLILSFEDSSGGIIEVKKEFEGTAFAENYFEPSDDFVDVPMEPIQSVEAEEAIPVWQIVLAGFGAFLVTFIVTKIITTKIIRKRLEDEL